MEPILLVEDKAELRAMLRKALERSGYTVDEAPDGNVAIEKVRSRTYQMVLSDLKLPGHSGIEVLREAKNVEPTLAGDSGDRLRLGGRSRDGDERRRIRFHSEARRSGSSEAAARARGASSRNCCARICLLREEYSARYGFPRIVGEHAGMKEASQMTQRVAATDSTVLLLGESGTGKELFARAIHHLSPRAAQPFVALNCAAIPEGLVENELFGHERGAYTGAGARKIGKLELAHRGTLFLDEIGDLPLAMQSKLLRVLEERRFERVGGTQEIEVNVRIVTATNKDLRAAVEDKTFREDLYFRIAAVPITIPPLRERGDDVLLLAEHFLERFRREFRKPALALTDEARLRLRGYAWPGNVRELQNTIERAAILAGGPEIGEQELQLPAPRPAREDMPDGMLEDEFLWEGPLDEVSQRAVAHVERFKIHNALRESKWNKTRAAESLGVSYKTLLTKIRTLGLEN